MDKLSIFGGLQKSIDTLKSTECSQKEKITHFGQISEAIVSYRSNSSSNSFQNHLSAAIGTLLMFCEETDSSVRMSAEENLNRIVRFCEGNGSIVRVQVDLYHEIKKNGNEKALRVCLALFAHYCGAIKQRKGKTYAQNLLPCIYAISKRREVQVLESLAAFIKVFSENLGSYMTDGEVLKITEVFVEDLAAECTTKRRCAAQNIDSFIDRSRCPEFYANNTFNRCIEMLMKSQEQNAVLGVLTCFRGILPIVLKHSTPEKSIEIFDLVLYFVIDGNHSVVNAALEVADVILNNFQPAAKKALISVDMEHRVWLLKRKTLKNSVFKINMSESMLNSRKSSTDAGRDLLKPDKSMSFLQVTSTPTKFTPGDDKSLASASDLELDFSKCVDIEHSLQIASSSPMKDVKAKTCQSDNISLKSQKSTDSIGSLINTFLVTSTNAGESMSKFFRKSFDSPASGSTPAKDADSVKRSEDDDLSLESLASSQISIQSSNADTIKNELDVMLEVDDSTMTDTLTMQDADPANYGTAQDELRAETPMASLASAMEDIDEPCESVTRDVFIGSIHDQNILDYTARLIASKFLLAGTKHGLIPDYNVRVSVKSMSLQILSQCVKLRPEVLLLTLEKNEPKDEFDVVEILNLEDAINEMSNNEETPPSGAEMVAASEPEGLLEIKEDHFGECTSTTYFEYFSPMSISLDQGLTSLKSKLKMVEENFSIMATDSQDKLSKELDAILSQSECSGMATRKGERRKELLVVPKVITSRGDIVTKRLDSDNDEDQQVLADVLLFYNHADQMLRANVLQIIGNFLRAVLESHGSTDAFLTYNEKKNAFKKYLTEDVLLQVIIQGFSDEIHIVVNQALSAFELVFMTYCKQQPFNGVQNRNCASNSVDFSFQKTSKTNFFMNENDQPKTSPQDILGQLFLVFNNKYWLVQCKVCEVFVNIDFKTLRATIGVEQTKLIQEKFFQQILILLRSSDFRVRNHAGEKLICYIENISGTHCAEKEDGIIGSFVKEHVLSCFANPIDVRYFSHPNNSQDLDTNIAKVLYTLSNKLLDLSDRNQLFGFINFLKMLIAKYNPFDYVDMWNEFNLLNVISSLMTEHTATALDLTAQNDLLEICSTLMIVTISSKPITGMDNEVIDKFIFHVLKLLNIYQHLLLLPVPVQKPPKGELFANPKELQLINCFGYFGNDPLYVKLYNLLRKVYESYKITISSEINQKFFGLLRTTITSLWRILEIKNISSMTNGFKFIEEVLRYLITFLPYEPEHCVRCTRFLLRFLFSCNYANRLEDVAYFREASQSLSLSDAVECRKFFDRYYEFCKCKNITSVSDLGSYIKQFEQMVIACLKIYSKTTAKVQTVILKLLCQLLDFNINYQLLDSSNVFVESVLKHVELLETGSIPDAERLMPCIVKFLFILSHSKDRAKIINIPKIINICDNLLANALIRKTAIASLQSLVHEIFLLYKVAPSGLGSELLMAEVATQKEVILNMMIKFPEEVRCYEIAPMVLLVERQTVPGKYEPEIWNALIGAMQEKKMVINCDRERLILKRVLETVNGGVNQDAAVGRGILGTVNDIFKSRDFTTKQKLMYYQIIFENIVLKYKEDELLHQVAPFSDEGPETIAETYLANLLCDILYSLIEGYQAQKKDTVLKNNMIDFIRIIGKMHIYPKIKLAFLNTLRINTIIQVNEDYLYHACICILLIKFGFEFKMITSTISEQHGTVAYEQLIEILIQMFSDREKASADFPSTDISYLINDHFVTLQTHFDSFLVRYISSPEYSDVIVMKTIATIRQRKVSSSTLFNLLEKSNLKSLPLLTEGLIDLLGETNVIIARRSAMVLDEKLNALLRVTPLDSESVGSLLPRQYYEQLFSSFTPERRKRFPKLFKTALLLVRFYEGLNIPQDLVTQIDTQNLKQLNTDEEWFLDQISFHCTRKSYTKPKNIARMLQEVNSESKLINLLSNSNFNFRLLREVIATAFENMSHMFRIDCVQFNPHLNYLKVHPMLKVGLIVLMRKLDEINATPEDALDEKAVLHCVKAAICFLENVICLEHLCLIYVEARFIDRFIKDHILKSNFYESLLLLALNCAKFIRTNRQTSKTNDATSIQLHLKCIHLILQQKCLWSELNQNDKYLEVQDLLIRMVFELVTGHLQGTHFLQCYQAPELFNDLIANHYEQVEVCLQALLVAQYISERDYIEEGAHLAEYPKQMMTTVDSVAISLLKMDRFYSIAMTPKEVFNCYSLDVDVDPMKLPSVPIDYLYELDTLEVYLKRVNIFGYSSKQQFEELFMSLLVLINREGDPEIMNYQEQYEIKKMCLTAIGNLLLTCYKYPRIGFGNGKYHHVPRYSTIKCTTVGAKKLHSIQLLIPSNSVFYQPNLERKLSVSTNDDGLWTNDNVIGTNAFLANQFSIYFAWQTLESSENESLVYKNLKYFIEKANLDVTSSVQLIYGILEQMIEDNYALILPLVVQFCEICENRDQIRHLYNQVLALQEKVPMEDTLSQQHIIYLLCKMAALLVPTMAELTHLCTIIPTYLKSTQLYIRNSTLNGLSCLLECLVLSNTTMGGLSEELQLLRNIVVNYVVKHGIIDESATTYSDMHSKLVWSLNFFLIETTSRYVVDCNLLQNSIISANNILKRTTNLEIYLCILNGLERLVLTNSASRQLLERIEKLSLDLVKLDNEMFALAALKLLLTCIYHSSDEQLENTERSNGIVQDEPEIIIQQIEKIEILFAKIRTTTPQGAKIFGNVLCQLIRDLLPPNEILTKVFKELMLNQPNPDIIAILTYQVFRSAIDCSYLALLQEWLICSLPNFLALPQINKSVWCLTVIFLSASLNQHLLKIFPEVLSLPSYQQLNEREINNLIISAKDFYRRLDPAQKSKFREIFQQSESYVYQGLLQSL
ncbi:huntingtin [Armigeres subalbatus]|uniref:huntingtin n=1 Tax=Armigeres subalbatus TaxID=124917 RepID=UPI002ED166E1